MIMRGGVCPNEPTTTTYSFGTADTSPWGHVKLSEYTTEYFAVTGGQLRTATSHATTPAVQGTEITRCSKYGGTLSFKHSEGATDYTEAYYNIGGSNVPLTLATTPTTVSSVAYSAGYVTFRVIANEGSSVSNASILYLDDVSFVDSGGP
jgi:hypothetical protein